MLVKNARIYTEAFTFTPGSLATDGEQISAQSGGGETLDAHGMLLIPGLIDIHLHGCVGYDFCDGTNEAFDAMTAYEGKNGVTSIVPASMSLPADQLLDIYHAAAAYEYNGGAMLCGINMEGPFFSHGKKGAQNGDYLLAPDLALFHQLNEACGGMVKLACVAPELPGALDYITALAGQVTISLAHTEADYELAMAAFARGASHVTHLFNAMYPLNHRAPGPIGAAADSGATAELICDGVHVHPSMVRMAVKLFTEDKILLISDSMMATGMPDGSYMLGGQQVSVEGNRCLLADGTIAGSATNLFDCMRSAVKFGIPLESAVRMASYNPARLIGALDKMGVLSPGSFANFVLMDDDLKIHAVYVKGRQIV